MCGRRPIRIEDFHKRPQRRGLNRRSQSSRRWSLIHAAGFMDAALAGSPTTHLIMICRGAAIWSFDSLYPILPFVISVIFCKTSLRSSVTA
jgi:hypothetical protein